MLLARLRSALTADAVCTDRSCLSYVQFYWEATLGPALGGLPLMRAPEPERPVRQLISIRRTLGRPILPLLTQRSVRSRLSSAGMNTFVCLQDELPPQNEAWPEEGVPNLSERAKWAEGNFQNYKADAGPDASFLHFGLPDLKPAKSLDALDAIVSVLHRRIENGEKLYIHCWGGRGRTGLVAACLLGACYGELNAEQALERVQYYYDLRQPHGREKISGSAPSKCSPETDEQANQVRDWFSFKRIVARADIAPRVTECTWSIYSKKKRPLALGGDFEILETVGVSANHPLTRAEALKRVGDAQLLGKGQFGQVFRGTCDGTNTCDVSCSDGDVAIKVMPDGAPSHEQSRLALEAKVMRAMSGVKGFPVLYYDGRQTVFGRPSDVLVMGMLGTTVRSLLQTTKVGPERSSAVRQIGINMIGCLRELHAAGYIHNDIKPLNILYGVEGSDSEGVAHLLDFGMVTSTGCLQEEVDGCELSAGGATPLYANVAQLEGRPTTPVDDIESLWYCLAFLEGGELPWMWEPLDRVRNIKKKLLVSSCAIVSDTCDSQLTSEEACSTAHCLRTYESWDCSQTLHTLWGEVLAGQETGFVDYDACLEALEEVAVPIDWAGVSD